MAIRAKHHLPTMLVALVAGFIGGQVGTSPLVVQAASGGTLRAQRIELTDKAGHVLAYLGSANGRDPGLYFLSRGRVMAALGERGAGDGVHPYLDMNGPAEKPYLTIRLDGQGNKPLIGMADEKWEGRILLGFLQPDTQDSSSDNWGLLFRASQGDSTVASLGMWPDRKSGHVSAKLVLTDEAGETWVLPR